MKSRMGDCYRIAANNVIDNKYLLLCHGIVSGQGKLKGKRIGHAWNELQDMVFDFSNGRQIIIRKEKYYRIGKIKKVKKYTRDEAIKLMLIYKSLGPW